VRKGLLLIIIPGLAVLLFLAWRVAGKSPVSEVRTVLSVQDVMGAGAAHGFRRALEPEEFQFPEDHGPHPDFRTEWWYVTGNLSGPGGEPYGVQLTIFRSALAPEDTDASGGDSQSPGTSSAWRTCQLYMGHFAVTDASGRRHLAFERFARGAVGLAGASSNPFRVWVEDWEMLGEPEGEAGPGAEDVFPVSLRAAGEGVSLALELDPRKPMVLQGRQGLSRKGPEPGNASFYYSFTRLAAAGMLRIEGDSIPVSGTAWMDREWSTSALSPGVEGWDWFALQLKDGHDLMYYQLRRRDGGADSLSEGIWVDPEGNTQALAFQEVELDVLEEWRSPLDDTRYPSAWSLRVSSLDLNLQITPIIPDQEMDLTFRYWEGSVRVRGTRDGEKVEGVGYVELTGYAPEEARSTRRPPISRTGGN